MAIKFKISSSETKDCETCMPAGIKLSKNVTIFCSSLRWFDNVFETFVKYNKEEKVFEPLPSLEMNEKY